MDDVTISKILSIYNDELVKKVRNKKRINDFEKYKITYIRSIYDTLKSGNFNYIKYNIFLIKEPKYRIIMSVGIYDKIINHYLTKYVLEPKLTKYLDDRNVATRKDMGTSYGIDLIKKYIEEEKKDNNIFYILKIDLRKYFYSIDHNVLKCLIKDKLSDIEYHLIELTIDSTNYSYINNTINKLKENEIKRNSNRSKEISELPLYNKEKGLAIGLVSNQFLAIFYLYKLHNYIIHKLKLKHSVFYMDDYIIMHKDKEYLKYALKRIEYILNNVYKLELNTKKTMITSSKEGFIFLQYKFKVLNNKTIIKLRRDTINKIRKNLKKSNYLYKNNYISFKSYFSSVNNYQNTFKYDRIKVSRIIDKYIG